MKAEEFVKQLSLAAPSVDDLDKAQFPSSLVDNLTKSYICVSRKSPIKLGTSTGNKDLDDLFSGWHLGEISISTIEFFDKPKNVASGVQIGIEEAEPLLASSSNGEIFIEEAGTGGHRLSDVAENGGKFLDAMLIVACFFSKRATKEISYEDFAAAKIAASDCATAAGGDKYLRFFMNFLGAEE